MGNTEMTALGFKLRYQIGTRKRTITTGYVTRFFTDSRSCRVLFHNEDAAMDDLSIATDGLSLEQFKRNPIVLAFHEQDRPIGTANDIQRIGNALHCRIDFAPAGVSAYADEVCGLVKAGILRGCSIGFSVVETQPMRTGLFRVTKSVLHEISMVALPSLDAALVTERSLKRSLQSAEVSNSNEIKRQQIIRRFRGASIRSRHKWQMAKAAAEERRREQRSQDAQTLRRRFDAGMPSL